MGWGVPDGVEVKKRGVRTNGSLRQGQGWVRVTGLRLGFGSNEKSVGNGGVTIERGGSRVVGPTPTPKERDQAEEASSAAMGAGAATGDEHGRAAQGRGRQGPCYFRVTQPGQGGRTPPPPPTPEKRRTQTHGVNEQRTIPGFFELLEYGQIAAELDHSLPRPAHIQGVVRHKHGPGRRGLPEHQRLQEPRHPLRRTKEWGTGNGERGFEWGTWFCLVCPGAVQKQSIRS